MEIISSVQHVAIPVTDVSQVGEARRAANSIAHELGFSEERSGKLAIIVTEAATNLARHAQLGEIFLCPSEEREGSTKVDVITVDHGPGIVDIHQSLGDGYSTGGTAGNGMGAIARLSDQFDIYSDRATGTVMLCRLYGKSDFERLAYPARDRFNVAYICIPKKGEHLCGDAVAIRLGEGSGLFMVADGLGHGIGAHEASRAATTVFLEENGVAPSKLLERVHGGLRPTRGAAVSIAAIDCATRTVKYSGVGNIAAAILQDATSRSMVSLNGIVGHQVHKIQEFSYPWPDSAGVLVMNSDGLQTNWRLTPYPGLLMKDPALIAAVLYRDFGRGRDDVGVLIVKAGNHE